MLKWRHRQKLIALRDRGLELYQVWMSEPKRALKHAALVLIAIWGLYVLQGWACTPRKGYDGPSWSPASAAGWAMSRYDLDDSGTISAEELVGSPGLAAAAERIDLNADGQLDEEEIAHRIGVYRESRDYLLEVTVHVTHGGVPLVGATVLLEPDYSIKGTIDPAEGVTDESGDAKLARQGGGNATTRPGIHPGIYLVRITKPDEEDADEAEFLPARYNTDTELGYEAAPDGGPEALRPEFSLLP